MNKTTAPNEVADNHDPVSGAKTRITARGKVRPRLVLASLVLAIASFQLNSTMLSPAIGDMSARLGTSPGFIGWSSTVFLAVAAALSILLPPFADQIGRRNALLGSVAVMIVGTVIALVSSDALWLLVGRALQGFVGAAFALSNLTLRSILEPRKYGSYLGLMAAVNSGIAGVDTLLGGIIVDAVGYKGILAVILAVAVSAMVTLFAWTPETRIAETGRMDWSGALTMTGALWGLNMVLTLGFGTAGWANPVTVLFAVGAIGCGVGFWFAESRTAHPLIPLAVLRQRQTWGLLVTTFCTLASAFATLLFTLPALSQDADNGFGMTGTASALLYLTPFSLLGWILAPLAGKVAPRVGYRLVLRFGLAGSLICLVAMVFATHDRWLLFILALLIGATYSAASNTTLNGLGVLYSTQRRPGVLPGLNSAAFNMGAAVGMGLMSSLVIRAQVDGAAAHGYSLALVVGAVFALLALVFSFLLPGRTSDSAEVI
ncbi:MFS transporter [Nocardia callitridis]|uniref:MFS transporter n=1 Tax=Nocardia callitridis TaxID=648753 RepID=A0ABP9KHG6_9NOCA